MSIVTALTPAEKAKQDSKAADALAAVPVAPVANALVAQIKSDAAAVGPRDWKLAYRPETYQWLEFSYEITPDGDVTDQNRFISTLKGLVLEAFEGYSTIAGGKGPISLDVRSNGLADPFRVAVTATVRRTRPESLEKAEPFAADAE